MPAKIAFDPDRVAAFCRKWGVTELSLFGSVLRDDFGPESDVDVMVRLDPESETSYWDWPPMMKELEHIFGRRIDLIARGGLRNPYRKREILRTAEVLYAA